MEGTSSGIGAVFAYHGGATDQEVCDMGSWRSMEVVKKYLRGVPSFLDSHHHNQAGLHNGKRP